MFCAGMKAERLLFKKLQVAARKAVSVAGFSATVGSIMATVKTTDADPEPGPAPGPAPAPAPEPEPGRERPLTFNAAEIQAALPQEQERPLTFNAAEIQAALPQEQWQAILASKQSSDWELVVDAAGDIVSARLKCIR